jgi:hypothetical protein
MQDEDYNVKVSEGKGIRGDGDAREVQQVDSDSRRDGANDSGESLLLNSNYRDTGSNKREDEASGRRQRKTIVQKMDGSEVGDDDDELVIEDDEEAENLGDSDSEAKDRQIMLVSVYTAGKAWICENKEYTNTLDAGTCE